MRFTASLSEFQKVLQRVIPAVPPKSTLPVLEHLKFELIGANLKLVATDQDISIMSSIAVETAEEGAVLVPARKLNEIIKALDTGGSFIFASDEENYDIQITTDKGKYIMKGLDPEEYLYLPELFESKKPELEDFEDGMKLTCVFDAGVLQRLASKTAFAISNDEYRLSMTGAFFQFRNGFVNCVATDSFRLVRAKAVSENFKFADDFDVLIPSRMMELLKKVDNEVIMSMIESMGKVTHVRVDFENTIFISRVVDEKFPPYETVIPQNVKSSVLIDAKAFVSAIRRVSLFANQVSKQVRFTFEENTVHLYAEEESSGNFGDETISCEYVGEKIEIGFNHKNLEELVTNIDSNETEAGIVEFLFFEPGKPVLIMPTKENEMLLSLIMPVRM